MHLRLDLEYFRAGAASGVGLSTRGDHVLRIKELRFGRLLFGIVNLLAFVLGGLTHYPDAAARARPIPLLLILDARNQALFRYLNLILRKCRDVGFLYSEDLFVQGLFGLAVELQVALELEDLASAPIVEYLLLLIRQSR